MLNNSGHCHLTLLHSIPCRKLHVIHKQILNLSEYGQLTLAGDSFLLRTMAAILATWLVMCGEESTCSTAAITPPASRLHTVYSAHQTSQFMSGLMVLIKEFLQCCGFKYLGSGSRILAQFGSGSIVMLLILKKKNLFTEEQFALKTLFLNHKEVMAPEELLVSLVSE